MDLLAILNGPGAIILYILVFLSLVIWWQLPLADPPFTPTQPVPPTKYLITVIGIHYVASIIELLVQLNTTPNFQDSDIAPPALFIVEIFLIFAPFLIIRENERNNRSSLIGKDRAALLLVFCIPGVVLEVYNLSLILHQSAPRPPVLGLIRPSWMTGLWYLTGLALMKLATLGLGGMLWLIWLPIVGIVTWEAIYATWPEGKGDWFWTFKVANRRQNAPDQLLFKAVGVAVFARALYVAFRCRGTIYRNILIWVERRRRRGEMIWAPDGQGGARMVPVRMVKSGNELEYKIVNEDEDDKHTSTYYCLRSIYD